MSKNPLIRRIERITLVLNPPSRIFDCTGAREELLATIETSMTEEEQMSSYHPTPEDLAEMEAFDSFLSDVIAHDEQEYNVRFVSYDE
jgi:hypothetical protein